MTKNLQQCFTTSSQSDRKHQQNSVEHFIMKAGDGESSQYKNINTTKISVQKYSIQMYSYKNIYNW